MITHHLPTPLCNSPNSRAVHLTMHSVVDKTDYIIESNIDYWIYGHAHRNIGNAMKLGSTTMLCNQLGYVDMNEHHDFSREAFLEFAT